MSEPVNHAGLCEVMTEGPEGVSGVAAKALAT